MNETFLERILSSKRIDVEAAKRNVELSRFYESVINVRQPAKAHRLLDTLRTENRTNIIAEFKRASPSKGVINRSLDPATVARKYEIGGACAISVLTDENFFAGSLDDLRSVRAAVDLPILRKDFIADEYQIYESAAAGADAILLIAAALTKETLRCFQRQAFTLRLDVVVEVHDLIELETAVSIDAKMIGVNNRDLKTFEVSLDVSRELIKHAPKDVVMIVESGLKHRKDLEEFRELGFSGFLIGEALMQSADPEFQLRTLAANTQE